MSIPEVLRILQRADVQGILLLGIYLVSIIVFRWHYIAVPTRRLALAQLRGLRQRWKQEIYKQEIDDKEEKDLEKTINQLLDQAETALRLSVWDFGQDKASLRPSVCPPPQDKPASRPSVRGFLSSVWDLVWKLVSSVWDFVRKFISSIWDFVLERLLWPRGAELKAWRLIHEAESLIALRMRPELAQERLEQLQEMSSSSQIIEISKSQNSSQVQAQLYWFLRKRYDEVDTSFAVLSAAHAKTSWLIYIGIILGGTLLVFGQAIGLPSEFRGWMLFGAIGAFLSRCLRMIRAPRVSTDYGFFWIQLFLAPVFGALAGPASILLLDLVITGLNVQALQTLQTGGASSPYIRLALSLLSGLSERWLDRLKDQAEGVLDKIEKPETNVLDKIEKLETNKRRQNKINRKKQQNSSDLPFVRGR